MGDAMHGVGGGEKACGTQVDTLHGVVAEVIVKPRPPSGAQRVPRLQDPAQTGTCAAAHQPEMAPALLRQQFEDDAGFAMALDAEHDAFIDPLHGTYVYTTRCHSRALRSKEPGIHNHRQRIWIP